jgi:hypothetical protein
MLITKAPPAAPIVLNSDDLAIFKTTRGELCFLEVPASAGLEMQLLNVTATGMVKPNQPGAIEVALFAYATVPHQGAPDATLDNWVMIGTAPAEPVGGEDDLPITSWMIRGEDLMYNLASGKMQGLFYSNVADHPVTPASLNTNPNGIQGDVSPVMYFAVAAKFTPTADDGSKPELQMANFTLSDGS